MRQACLKFAAALVYLGASLGLQATVFNEVNATTTCIVGRSQDFCTLAGSMLGPKGVPLAGRLADIYAIADLVGERPGAFLDRSMEMTNQLADVLEDNGDSPLVVGPQMMSSIQLSFDAQLDLSRPRRMAGPERYFDARRPSTARHRRTVLDSLQFELTLGTAMTLRETEQTISGRALGKSDYVSFSLVNQAHFVNEPAAVEEPEQAEDILQ